MEIELTIKTDEVNQRRRGSRLSLTTNQKKYVRNNYRRMVVKEMAENLKVPVGRIYSFMTKEKIEYIKTKPATRATNREFGEGMFNVFARENWLV